MSILLSTSRNLGTFALTEYSFTAVSLAFLPILSLRSGDSINIDNFFFHASADPARNPFTPSFIRSAVTPTGDETQGIPTLIYRIALKAHLPLVHFVSGIGIMPISKFCKAPISFSQDQ